MSSCCGCRLHACGEGGDKCPQPPPPPPLSVCLSGTCLAIHLCQHCASFVLPREELICIFGQQIGRCVNLFCDDVCPSPIYSAS